MASNNKSYRVVIIEPSMIISTGLRKLIEIRHDFEVVASIADCYHCVEKINHLDPDIIIINPSTVEPKRRQHLEELFEGVKSAALVALVYQYMEPEVLKQYHTVIDISDDADKIAQKLLQSMDALNAPADGADKNELSEREKEILVSLAKGKINKEIADQHHISVHTVITHRKNIIRKTGIKSVSGLTVYAILNNLIDINEVE